MVAGAPVAKVALGHTRVDTKAGACAEERARVELRLSKPQTADWLRQESQRGVLCQAALACGLCERVGWHNPRGKPCADSARKALLKLAAGSQLP